MPNLRKNNNESPSRLSRWLKYRKLRFLVNAKNRSITMLRRLENKPNHKMDQIQQTIYDICMSLITDAKSELRSSMIDFTYHIETDNHLIIIRQVGDSHSINLIEYKSDGEINNFDIPFESRHIKDLQTAIHKEVHKRMKSRQILRKTRVSKHLKSILDNIEDVPKKDNTEITKK